MNDTRDPTPAQRFGVMLRAARTNNGLTQADIVDRIGDADRVQVGKWEAGVHFPSRRRLLLLLAALPELKHREVWPLYVEDMQRRVRLRDEAVAAKQAATVVTDPPVSAPKIPRSQEPPARKKEATERSGRRSQVRRQRG